eukprot:732485_1
MNDEWSAPGNTYYPGTQFSFTLDHNNNNQCLKDGSYFYLSVKVQLRCWSETPFPTRSPTHPTTAPTGAPTTPTTLPTIAPSLVPTFLPSQAPSNTPTSVTRAPTNAPSAAPSIAPTQTPTIPTLTPTTAIPSLQPRLNQHHSQRIDIFVLMAMDLKDIAMIMILSLYLVQLYHKL